MAALRDAYLVTCEHGGNRVPKACRTLFASQQDLLQSHRGWDPGALAMARDLARALAAPLCYATVSRLVIDLNRSIGHPRLYSQITRPAPRILRREILIRHYLPYRDRVEQHVAASVAAGRRVIHLSAHSFTAVLDGAVRNADVGLLYDPARAGEASLCRHWQAALKVGKPELRVRRNYPYSGTSDGFTAYLRRRFPAQAYVGIELEINQKHVDPKLDKWRELRASVVSALLAAFAADTARGN